MADTNGSRDALRTQMRKDLQVALNCPGIRSLQVISEESVVSMETVSSREDMGWTRWPGRRGLGDNPYGPVSHST